MVEIFNLIDFITIISGSFSNKSSSKEDKLSKSAIVICISNFYNEQQNAYLPYPFSSFPSPIWIRLLEMICGKNDFDAKEGKDLQV